MKNKTKFILGILILISFLIFLGIMARIKSIENYNNICIENGYIKVTDFTGVTGYNNKFECDYKFIFQCNLTEDITYNKWGEQRVSIKYECLEMIKNAKTTI